MSAYRFSIDSRLTQLYRDAVPLSGDETQLESILNPRTGQIELFTIGRDGDVYNICPGSAPVSLGFRQQFPDSEATCLAIGQDFDYYFVVAVAFRNAAGDGNWFRFMREGRSGPRWPIWNATALAEGGAQVSGGRFAKLLLGDTGQGMPALFACWEPTQADGNGTWKYSYYYLPKLWEAGSPTGIYDMWLPQRQPIPLAWGREPKLGSSYGTYLYDTAGRSLAYLSQGPAMGFQGRGPRDAYPLALASVDLGSLRGTPVFIAGSDGHLRYLDTAHDLTGDVIAEMDTSTVGQLAGSARPDGRMQAFVLQGTTLHHVVQDPATRTGWGDLVPLRDGISHFEAARNKDGFTEVFAVTRETSPRMLRLRQDPTTSEWATDEIDVPARDVKPQPYFAFVTGVTVLDDQGAPVVNQPVRITPTTAVAEFLANGLPYEADPASPVTCPTNERGKVVIIAPTLGLDTPELTVSTTPPSGPALRQTIVANTAVQDRLYAMTRDQLLALRTHGPDGVLVLGANPDPAVVDAMAYGMRQLASIGRAPQTQAAGFSLRLGRAGLEVIERSADELAARARVLPSVAAAGAAADSILDAALGDVLGWMTEAGQALLPPNVKVSDIIDFTLRTIEQAGQKVVQSIDWALEVAINGARYIFQATVETLQEALDAVGAFLRTAGQFLKDVGEKIWDDILDALGDLLDWRDAVYDVKNVFKHVFQAFLAWLPDQIEGLKGRIDASLQDVTGMLAQVAQATGSIDPGYGGSTLQQDVQQEESSPDDITPRSDLDWMIDALTSPDVSGSDIGLDPALITQLENLWTALSDNALPIAQDVIDLVGDAAAALASQTPEAVAAITHAAKDELDIVNRLRTIAFALVDVLAEVVRSVGQQAGARIDVPILTDFYEQILSFGQEDSQLSVLDATCLVLAAQAMAAYTAGTGKTDAPFSKADLARLQAAPWESLINGQFARPAAASAAGADPAAVVYTGLVTLAGSAFYFVEMGLGLAADNAGKQAIGSKWVALFRTVARFVLFGTGCPMIFHGVPTDTTSAAGRGVVLWGFQGYFCLLYAAIPCFFKAFLGRTGGSRSYMYKGSLQEVDVLDIVNGALETVGGLVSFALVVNTAVLEKEQGPWRTDNIFKAFQSTLTSVFQATAVARPFLKQITPWGKAAVAGIHVLGRGGAGAFGVARAIANMVQEEPTWNDTFGG